MAKNALHESVAGFYNNQYLWKKLITILDFFLHGVNYQGRLGSETTTFGCVYSDVPFFQSDYRIL